jgi:cell division transport system permease protein
VPAEVALSRLAESLGEEAHVLEGVGPGALPDAIEIDGAGISLEGARELAARLRAVPGADDVDYGTAWLEPLERFVARARAAGIALFVALALATAILVSNTLRLAVFARREEIEIMKLVGATDAFVAAPFLLEGLLQGLLGAGAAVLALVGVHGLVVPRLAAAVAAAGGLTLADTLPPALLLSLLGGGAAIGLRERARRRSRAAQDLILVRRARPRARALRRRPAGAASGARGAAPRRGDRGAPARAAGALRARHARRGGGGPRGRARGAPSRGG